MTDFPGLELPPPPVITPFHYDSLGSVIQSGGGGPLSGVSSATWPVNNKAFYYPFRLTSFATCYQLLFWVGATSSGNIDVAIYDQQKNRVVSSGSTAMSATVNTVQELNITDTDMKPGDYLLAGACSTTSGTCFRSSVPGDEITLPMMAIYEQTTALPLPDPGVPVVTTDATPGVWCIGAQFRSIF